MRILLTFAGATIAVLLMTGCLPQPDDVTPTPQPSSSPVFASDEEALAAAEVAYGEYEIVSDTIFSEGGVQPERLEEVAAGDFLVDSIHGFENVQSQGLRSVGSSKFDQVTLQQFDPTSAGGGIVVTYLCEDVSEVDVLNSDGESVVSVDRPDRTYFQVTFDLADDGKTLLVSGREVWGDGAC